ncbi:MAG: porin, partial [Acidobacteriota bacterium]
MIRGVENFPSGARFVTLATALGLALSLAPAASADDWTTQWSNGFKVESKDKAFKLKFGGRIQADYTFVDADDLLEPLTEGDGFEFRRARIFFSGTIYNRILFKANYDFAGGDADFNDVYIGIKQNWGEIRFGHFKEYFSLELSNSSKYIAFLERSLNQAFSPGRGSGVGVHGNRGDKMNWGIGAFYDADGFGISTSEDNVNITGRVTFRPIFEDTGRKMVHIGFSATQKDRESQIRFRSRPEAHFTDRFVDTGNFSADDALIWGLELAGVNNNFWYAAEYTQAEVGTPVGSDPTFD